MRNCLLLLLGFCLLAGTSIASATPLPGSYVGDFAALAPPPGGHVDRLTFQLNLYETVDNTPTGVPTETPPAILLPSQVGLGTVVIMEDINADPYNAHNWSDVLDFFANADGYWAQLTSDDELLPLGFDQFLVDRVLAAGFYPIQETATPTLWQPGAAFPDDNEYYIYSDAPEAPVPEPATALLLGVGLAGAYGLVRRRRS